jgi:uncharacterized protein YxjI
MLEQFQARSYTVRKKVLKLLGGAFHIYDDEGTLQFYSKQKAFKLKEDIRLYSDESMRHEVLAIRARTAIDFSAAYDIFDSENSELVGTMKRSGWRSISRDHWTIFDASDNQVGTISEDSGLMAFLRRFASNLIPQTFHAELAGEPMCTYRQHFNPFIYKLDIEFPADAAAFERIMGIAGGVLLAAIEGRQG